jgi:hypothetical protein
MRGNTTARIELHFLNIVMKYTYGLAGSVLRIQIRDPVPFLTPGSGIRDGYKIKIRIRD